MAGRPCQAPKRQDAEPTDKASYKRLTQEEPHVPYCWQGGQNVNPDHLANELAHILPQRFLKD